MRLRFCNLPPPRIRGEGVPFHQQGHLFFCHPFGAGLKRDTNRTPFPFVVPPRERKRRATLLLPLAPLAEFCPSRVLWPGAKLHHLVHPNCGSSHGFTGADQNLNVLRLGQAESRLRDSAGRPGSPSRALPIGRARGRTGDPGSEGAVNSESPVYGNGQLNVWLFVANSRIMSVGVFVCLLDCLVDCLLACLFACLLLCFLACLQVCLDLFVCLPVCRYLSVCLFLCLSVSLSICLSALCLFVSVSMSLCLFSLQSVRIGTYCQAEEVLCLCAWQWASIYVDWFSWCWLGNHIRFFWFSFALGVGFFNFPSRPRSTLLHLFTDVARSVTIFVVGLLIQAGRNQSNSVAHRASLFHRTEHQLQLGIPYAWPDFVLYFLHVIFSLSKVKEKPCTVNFGPPSSFSLSFSPPTGFGSRFRAPPRRSAEKSLGGSLSGFLPLRSTTFQFQLFG